MPRGISIPPITRACLLSCVGLSVLNAALRYSAYIRSATAAPDAAPEEPAASAYAVPYLSIVPAQSIVYPWTLVTATLVEQNIFSLAVTLATLFYGGKYLERAWGSRELGKFLLVVTLVPNFLTFVVYVFWFALSGNPVRSFTPICGAIAIQAGFLVAFKQLVPEYTVRIFKNMIRVRIKRFPAIFLLANTVSGPLFGTDVAVFLAWFGFFAGWTYLRFYKKTFPDLESGQSPSLKGDASETFAMIYFFPEAMHKPVAIVSDTVYNVLLALKICTPFSDADITLSNSRAEARVNAGLGSFSGGPSNHSRSARAEAERRRELALRALDQQLQAATNKNAASRSESRPESTPGSSNSR